ncbi:MAG: LytTR family transcriptional regulator DNA-binding domain-containing protein [Bacteroidaceae bacterium]|nr:LytTR family transcriptional regulator DNA-binding domain-containing protein [Bacteroidaceae bacterium]
MMTLYIETRDEIHVIDLSTVLYLKANRNYTDFFYADGRVKSKLLNISFVESRISEMTSQQNIANPFVHVGRSLLVNINLVEVLSLKLQKIVFKTSPPISIPVSKLLLRGFKEKMSQRLGKESYSLRDTSDS